MPIKKPKPSKTRIRAWVKALREGKYKQATDALRQGSRYCCLGVACDLYRKETGNGRWDRDAFVLHGNAELAVLPPSVAAHLGVTVNPRLKLVAAVRDPYNRKRTGDAATLNDDGASFDEIADMIERTYLK